MKKSLIFVVCLIPFTIASAFAADPSLPSPSKCPAEILENPQAIRLSKAFPHFRLNWGEGIRGDEFYEVCKKMNFSFTHTTLSECKRVEGLTPFVNDRDGLYIIGTQGRNFIRASQFNDHVCGLGKSDIIVGGVGDDHLYGNGGNDYIEGREGDDHLYGGKGKDHLWGYKVDEDGPYVDENGDLVPGTDDDYLYGGRGKDYLGSGPGNDSLYGENAKDYLNGGQGDDIIDGGNGQDRCVDRDGGTDECAATNAANTLLPK